MKLAIRIFVEQGDEFDRVPVRISEVEPCRWHPSDHRWLRLSGVGADPAAAGLAWRSIRCDAPDLTHVQAAGVENAVPVRLTPMGSCRTNAMLLMGQDTGANGKFLIDAEQT